MYSENIEHTYFFEDQTITSKKTSINGRKLPRLFKLIEDKYGWEYDSINFDIGGGRYDNATDYLGDFGVRNLIFDPYNRDEEHNNRVMSEIDQKSADTVTISNVLCVVKESFIQNLILNIAYKSLKPGGIMYATVYEGNKSGIGAKTGKDQWQEHRKTSDYIDQVNRVFGSCDVKSKMIIAIKEP